MATDDSVIVTLHEHVNYEITLTYSRLAELLGVDVVDVTTLLADVRGWKPTRLIENHLLSEIDYDTHRPGSTTREWGLRTIDATVPPHASAVTTNLADISDEILAAAVHFRQRRTRELIAEGSSDEEALQYAGEEAAHYARRLIEDAKRRDVMRQLVEAHDGNTYRLMRDVADYVGASLAYVDRATVEAHLERTLSEAEWTAIRDQFGAMDFDAHVGDQQTFRTDWIETVLEQAGVPGFGQSTDGQPARQRSGQADVRAAGVSRHITGVGRCTDRVPSRSPSDRESNSLSPWTT